jgi:hypothetical protein
MRLLLLMIASFADPTYSNSDHVVIRTRPTNVVEEVTGSCGPNRYHIGLRHAGDRVSLNVDVNGRAVSRKEIAKVIAAVHPGYYLFQPFVDACFEDRPEGRMRLVTDGPGSHGQGQWLFFNVSPTGTISDVQPE